MDILPNEFILQPRNKAHRTAMLEQLGRMGAIYRGSDAYQSNALYVKGRMVYGERPNNFSYVPLTLTLDELYTGNLHEALPEIEVAGVKLTIKNGQVFGVDVSFCADIPFFIKMLQQYTLEYGAKLGGYTVERTEYKIGCKIFTRDELLKLLEWAKENS